MAKKSTGTVIKLFPEHGYSITEEQKRNAIGRRIAELREEKGLSLAELSESLKPMGLSLDRTTIGKWERGASAPNVVSVAEFLDSIPFKLLFKFCGKQFDGFQWNVRHEFSLSHFTRCSHYSTAKVQ